MITDPTNLRRLAKAILILIIVGGIGTSRADWTLGIGTDIYHTREDHCATSKRMFDEEAAQGRYYQLGECPYHVHPAYYLDARYSKKWWSAYLMTYGNLYNDLNPGFGLELFKSFRHNRFGVGVGLAHSWIRTDDFIVSSPTRWTLRGWWCPGGGKVCGEILHQSCFQAAYETNLIADWLSTCDENDINRGYNFLNLRIGL